MKKKFINILLTSAIILPVISFTVSCVVDNKIDDEGMKMKINVTQQELFDFISSGNIAKLEEYLKNGGDVEVKNGNMQTLLLAATDINNIEIAELLLKYKADVNSQDKIQDSPFLLAGARGYHELVTMFLKHKPRFDIFNRYNGTALIPAAEKTHVETVKILANTPGYPINHVNRLGWTALMEAVILATRGPRQTETVRLLLEAGADKNIPDRGGMTPLQHAISREYADLIELLKDN